MIYSKYICYYAKKCTFYYKVYISKVREAQNTNSLQFNKKLVLFDFDTVSENSKLTVFVNH